MTWLIVRCMSSKEQRGMLDLGRHIVADMHCPAVRAQNKASPGKRYTWRALVPGYIFVDWGSKDPVRLVDICRMLTEANLSGGTFLKVLSPGGTPYAVTDDEMAQMRDMPDRLRKLAEDAEAAEKAAREARRPRVGEPARIMEGVMTGRTVVVTRVSKRAAFFETILGEASVLLDPAVRVAPE